MRGRADQASGLRSRWTAIGASGSSFLRNLALSGGSTVAIMEQPHIPLGLPGYRALMWLGLIIAVRLTSGAWWASGVGAASALGTLAIGRSPDGLWGVMQYVIAALVVDAVLAWWPSVTRRVGVMLALGAGSLALVGWIAPLGQGFSAGAGVGDLWYALSALGWHAWARLVGFDLLFGIGAAVVGLVLARLLSVSRLLTVSVDRRTVVTARLD